MKNMGHKQSIADPCMYFSRNKAGKLAIWLCWVDDNLIVGPPQVVKDEGKKMVNKIKIEDVGELKEFVECKVKIDKSEQSAKFTQPDMMESFLDEFSAGKKKGVMPAEANTVLKRPESGEILANKDQSKYQSGIGKMMNMVRWSRLDIYNVSQDCTRHMMLDCRSHYNAMVCIMDY